MKCWLAWVSALAGVVTLSVQFGTPACAQEDVSETYAAVRKSIAFVLTAKGGKPLAMGSAFCIYSDARHSIFITNRHVVQGSDAIAVLVQGPTPVTARARALRVSSGFDVAVLDVPRGNIPALVLAGTLPEEGTRVGIAGYPRTQVLFGQFGLGLTPSLHVGIVNALPGRGAFIQFDAQVEPGNSGGPLFDTSSGRVYGIVTAKVKTANESNLAVPAFAVAQIARNAHVPFQTRTVDAIVVARADPTPEPTPSPSPTPAWDVAECKVALGDFGQAYEAWNGAYNRYSEATRKTASAASGATNAYAASVVGVYVSLEIRAINSVINAEEPKLVNAQQQIEMSRAPFARLTDLIINHVRAQDQYAQQWSYSRQRAVSSASAGRGMGPIDNDAFARSRSEQDALTSAMSDFKFAPKCDP